MNFEYHDGNELICRILEKYFNMKSEILVDEVTGIWFSVVRVYDELDDYEVVWDEDMGNLIYSTDQSEEINDRLEERVKFVAEKLNEIMQEE